MDREDPLAPFARRFERPDPDLIYVDGNSLGRLPKDSIALADEIVRHQWGDRLIRSWNEGWLELQERIGNKIAHLIGAEPGEVILADSTSVNLFKLALAAIRQMPDSRRVILSDTLNFPSDLHIMEGIAQLAGRKIELKWIPSPDGCHGPVEAIVSALDEKGALLTLSHTVFKSGYTYDLVHLTRAAQRHGVWTLWDLSHSVGSVPVDLGKAGAELAVGCTYKYLNGGPGAPAFLYVRKDLQEVLANPISGWIGRDRFFEFDLDYRPAFGIRRFLTGTPPVLSTSLVEKGVDLLIEAGMKALRQKAQRQIRLLLDLYEAHLRPLGFTLNSPQDPQFQGSHISLGHPHALGIDLALIHEMKVLPDFRAPDNIRIGIAPLYNSFWDIYETVRRIRQVVEENRFEKYEQDRPEVT